MSAVATLRPPGGALKAPGVSAPLDVKNVLWLLAAMVFVVGPHLLRLPVWVTIFFLVTVAWRAWISWSALRSPPRWFMWAEEDRHPRGQPQQVRAHDEHHCGEQPQDVAHIQGGDDARGADVGDRAQRGASKTASASRQRARCASPRPDAISRPGSLSP